MKRRLIFLSWIHPVWKSEAIVPCQRTVDCLLCLGDELLPQAKEFLRVSQGLTSDGKMEVKLEYCRHWARLLWSRGSWKAESVLVTVTICDGVSFCTWHKRVFKIPSSWTKTHLLKSDCHHISNHPLMWLGTDLQKSQLMLFLCFPYFLRSICIQKWICPENLTGLVVRTRPKNSLQPIKI